MATVDYTVNSDSTSPDPLFVDPEDTVVIRQGTNPPSRILIEPSGLFESDVVDVPSTQIVRAQSGDFDVFADNGAKNVEAGGVKIGTIRVRPSLIAAA